jgi:N-acetylmuramoyl-L-alanine amidase
VRRRAADLIAGMVFLLLSQAGSAQPAEPAANRGLQPVASDARVGGDATLTRFVMDFSRKVDLHAFTLADPYRVVIDMPQVTFNLPPLTGESGRGLVKAFRYGLVMHGGSRIVLDVTRPVVVEKAFVLEPGAGQPTRLVVDLVGTDRETFMRNLARNTPPTIATSGARETEPARPGDPRPIIVLDPGHGGLDFGTVAANGVMEKTIVLDFTLLLRDQLEKSGKYRVVMTRTEDTFIPLVDRMRMARIRQASLFISIHADALKKREGYAEGATVYTLSETASDAEAAHLAETENHADVIAGIDLSHESNDVADILIDLAQRETRAFSNRFAHLLMHEMKGSVRMHKHPLKAAGFRVLKAPDVPSVLVELGYVSNKSDLQQLTSESWRAKTVATMAQAVEAFFAKRVVSAVPAN